MGSVGLSLCSRFSDLGFPSQGAALNPELCLFSAWSSQTEARCFCLLTFLLLSPSLLFHDPLPQRQSAFDWRKDFPVVETKHEPF